MKHTSRLASIDCFRGFAVMIMAMGSHYFTMVQSFALISALTAVARFMERREWIISL